jgi:sugar O-acyltransferase (sialic acid O-acetyltransferase NeuD family)
MSKRVILLGAGGFGREVIAWTSDAYKAGAMPEITSFADDNPTALARFSYDLEYLGSIMDLKVNPDDLLLVGVASPLVKKKIFENFSEYIDQFLTLIHPSAVVASTATIGRGVVICPFALISADTQISDFVTINVMSSIGHDSIIGKFSTLSGHVDVTGQVQVGEAVFFGSGAKIIPRIKIGENSKIGAGCTVMRSVLPNVTYYTTPAKKLS